MRRDLVRSAPTRKLISRLRTQVLLIGLTAFFVPLLAPLLVSGMLTVNLAGTTNTQAASLVAAISALLMFRRISAYPGSRAFAYLLPAFSTAFGLVAAALLVFRISYSGSMLLAGYVTSFGVAFLLWYLGQRGAVMRMFVVPGGNTEIVDDARHVEWTFLSEPRLPADHEAPIVADLRSDHPAEWERMLAEAAISGRTVYHTKQLRESLTGRVQIEHLSENSFGSLLPNLAYRGVKRFVDVVTCLVALPVLAIPMLVVAILIRRDSPGPALFRQQRMGYQGRTFNVLKFRTMKQRSAPLPIEAQHDSMTRLDDERITKLGRLLRRTRIDELPQIINVLRGEMTWIGPRPEALSLSQWYERELPFYSYRHIVRPGITGWAQVNQGHVAELDDVHVKLHYDFYYIKHFSAWIDILIAMRTISTVLTGYGAK